MHVALRSLAAMDDAFRALTQGIRFNSAHQDDIAAFKKSRKRGPDVRGKAVQSLDFFGKKAAPRASAPRGGERKRARGAASSAREGSADGEHEDAEDAGEGADTGAGRDEEAPRGAASRATMGREEVRAFRRRMRITVKGEKVPAPRPLFEEMPWELSDASTAALLQRNVEQSDWKEPTAIQMQALPCLMSGRDVLAAAPTGSGKTAAFCIPTLAIAASGSAAAGVKLLYLAPTRELAAQIHREASRLATGLRCAGGRKFRIQLLGKAQAATAVGAAARGEKPLDACDAIVATPLRLLSVLRSGAVSLEGVLAVVLDEADRLFEADDGRRRPDASDGSDFLAQVDEIMAACPARCQRALFSATVGDSVKELAVSVLRDACELRVGGAGPDAASESVEQSLVFSGSEEGKLISLRRIVQEGLQPPALLFVQSKDRARRLHEELAYDGLNVDAVHAGRTQQQRDAIVKRFRRGEIWLLICTDLMARGIDFKGVNVVINFDFPQSPVAYIHRIGRTGRAGRAGRAITLFTEEDMKEGRLRPIANVVRQSGGQVPDWMLKLKKPTTRDKRRWRQTTPRRAQEGVSTASRYDRSRGAKRRNMVKQSKGARGERKEKGKDKGAGQGAGAAQADGDGGGWEDASAFNDS